MLFSSLVFVLPATCTTTRLHGGARRRPHHRRRLNSTTGSLDSYIEGSRLFHVTVASQFEHFISLWRPNCSLVVDDQLQLMAFTVCTAGVLVVGYPGCAFMEFHWSWVAIDGGDMIADCAHLKYGSTCCTSGGHERGSVAVRPGLSGSHCLALEKP